MTTSCRARIFILFGLFIFLQRLPAEDAVTADGTALPRTTAETEEVTVTGEGISDYAALGGTGATKTDIPLLETPQAVSIVTRALIEDEGARKLDDVLKNVAGVTPGGYYSDWDYYRIRGFDAAFTTYWDGLRGDYGKNVELFGVERIEILKGPASSLYGQGPLGGLVNIVSKHPRPEDFGEVQFTIGSYGFYEPAIDTGMVLNSNKTLYFRLNALYRDQDLFVDFVNKHRLYLAPSLTWEIGQGTTLTILVNYVHDWDQVSFPLPAIGTVLPNVNGEIPINRFVGEPDKSNQIDQWRARIDSELRHRFNETFSLRQNLSFSRLWQDWNNALYPSSLDPDQRTLYRYPYALRETLDRIAIDTALEAKFGTGAIEHYLVGGLDYYRTDTSSNTQQIDYSDFPGSYPSIDLFHPVYGTPLPPYATSSATHSESDWWGIYLQEHAKFLEHFTILLGGRYDWTSSDNNSAEAFTGRVGLTYEFVKGAALYANYSESFNPQWYYTDASGKAVQPETGENFEVGLKTSLWNGRISTLLALYHLTRENVATDNPTTPNPFDSIVSGEQRSRGVELEGSLKLAPGWDLTAAYTFTDAEITKDNLLPVGARLQGVPEHTFSAWMKYTVQEGLLQGLGFGIGGRYFTDQEGDATYVAPFKLPAYGTMDAAVYYKRGRFRAQINVTNLLDERYFAGAYNDLYVLPGEPINVRATLGWMF